mmetsp:Transcript_3798/g.4712  ORF Transcript_3798/g.4712 Transcript_3798/m.4712 type:complete len:94 (+) Transcript_3798:825-1106(+)
MGNSGAVCKGSFELVLSKLPLCIDVCSVVVVFVARTGEWSGPTKRGPGGERIAVPLFAAANKCGGNCAGINDCDLEKNGGGLDGIGGNSGGGP